MLGSKAGPWVTSWQFHPDTAWIPSSKSRQFTTHPLFVHRTCPTLDPISNIVVKHTRCGLSKSAGKCGNSFSLALHWPVWSGDWVSYWLSDWQCQCMNDFAIFCHPGCQLAIAIAEICQSCEADNTCPAPPVQEQSKWFLIKWTAVYCRLNICGNFGWVWQMIESEASRLVYLKVQNEKL